MFWCPMAVADCCKPSDWRKQSDPSIVAPEVRRVTDRAGEAAEGARAPGNPAHRRACIEQVRAVSCLPAGLCGARGRTDQAGSHLLGTRLCSETPRVSA